VTRMEEGTGFPQSFSIRRLKLQVSIYLLPLAATTSSFARLFFLPPPPPISPGREATSLAYSNDVSQFRPEDSRPKPGLVKSWQI